MLTANPMNLIGKRVLVTGASSGVGRETAILLSELGAHLVLTGRNRDALTCTFEALAGCGHRIEPFDLSDGKAIPGWLKCVATKDGALGGVAHCAGIHSFLPLRVMEVEAFEAIQRINVTAALMLAKGIRQKGCCLVGTSVVFLSSVSGIVGQSAASAYSASKAAVIGLTRSLALELARDGIRVNSVAPGIVRSEMAERIFRSLDAHQIGAIEAAHPLGFGTPRDVAHAVAFLLSGAARWITGSVLVVDGGYTAH